MKKGTLLIYCMLVTWFIAFSQAKKMFSCPIKKGRIVVVEDYTGNEGVQRPGATFIGKSKRVYSCSQGIVKKVNKTDHGTITLYIEFEDYLFAYHNLESINVEEGQQLQKDDLLGKLKTEEQLFLIISKADKLIEPANVIKCKVTYRNIR